MKWEQKLTKQDRKRCPEHRTHEMGSLETWVPWIHFWQHPSDKKNFKRPKQFLFDKLNNIARPLARPHKDKNQGKQK